MPDYPDDIFTEPSDVDPDTLANLGPLRRLAGTWEGKRGIDLNPKADGPERRPYFERIEMQPIDPQANGPQLLYGLRYHQHVNTEEEDITFHDQVGYWLWEPATGLIMQTLTIPRGQVAISSGQAAADADKLVVTSERGQTSYGIHGTIEPDTIGRQASMGCVRLKVEDVQLVYDMLSEGKSRVLVMQ